MQYWYACRIGSACALGRGLQRQVLGGDLHKGVWCAEGERVGVCKGVHEGACKGRGLVCMRAHIGVYEGACKGRGLVCMRAHIGVHEGECKGRGLVCIRVHTREYIRVCVRGEGWCT
eukprot:1160261-Pelagomonas_calceolata.AAC.11